jgi:hypothetical protein
VAMSELLKIAYLFKIPIKGRFGLWPI